MKKRICLLAVCIFLASFAGCSPSGRAAEGIDAETLYTSLSSCGDTAYFNGRYTTAHIANEADAVASLGGLCSLFGISDPQAELIPEQQYTVNGCWYRLNQYYQGIPVYGRYITVMTDRDGNAMGLMANTKDITGCASAPTLTEAEVRALSADTRKLPEEAAALTYYTYDGAPQLCYSFDNGLQRLFLSADTGAVVFQTPLRDYEDVSYTFGENGEHQIRVDLTDSLYTLKDARRNITIFSVIEEEREDRMAFDSQSETITWEKKELQEEETGDFMGMLSMKWIETAYDYFADPDTYACTPIYEGEPCNIEAFIHARQVYMTVNEETGLHDLTNNAYYEGIDRRFTITLGNDNTSAQTISHEYTHGIIAQTAGLADGEAMAINEGCADIFAELIEASTSPTGECDWACKHRSFSNPVSGNSKCLDNYENYRDDTDPHYGGTIISHAAYLMHSDGIGFESLGKLYFRTLLLCSAGTDMHSFCYIMNAVAGQMRDNGELSAQDQETIEKAFIAVGLMEEPTAFFTSVRGNPDILITNAFGNPATNVKLQIEGMDISKAEAKAVSVEHTQELTTPGAVQTDLSSGAYKLTVTGRHDTEKVVGYIVVREEGADDAVLQVPFRTEISGNAYDAVSGDPLGQTSVTAYSADGQTMLAVTTTDMQGAWTLPLPDDNYRLVWACDGYESLTEDLSVSEFPPRKEPAFAYGRTDLCPDLPCRLSACIGEYGGVTYCNYEVPNSGFTALPCTAAEYDYISSFLFYRGKLYYCCKDAGTSDYRSALYRCNPDGSEPEKLFGDSDLDSTVSFHISNGILYPHGGSQYYDIAQQTLVKSEEYLYDFGALPDWYSIHTVFTQQRKADTVSRAKYVTGSPYERSDWADIVKLDNSWSRICGLTSKALFYQTEQGNTAYLYRYDLKTGAISLVDSKQTAGSGGYFNW